METTQDFGSFNHPDPETVFVGPKKSTKIFFFYVTGGEGEVVKGGFTNVKLFNFGHLECQNSVCTRLHQTSANEEPAIVQTGAAMDHTSPPINSPTQSLMIDCEPRILISS